jgi:hypothetical protein
VFEAHLRIQRTPRRDPVPPLRPGARHLEPPHADRSGQRGLGPMIERNL